MKKNKGGNEKVVEIIFSSLRHEPHQSVRFFVLALYGNYIQITILIQELLAAYF